MATLMVKFNYNGTTTLKSFGYANAAEKNKIIDSYKELVSKGKITQLTFCEPQNYQHSSHKFFNEIGSTNNNGAIFKGKYE